MVYRGKLVSIAFAVWMGACEQHSDLGGRQQVSACIDCPNLDAGDSVDAEAQRPGSRFDSGSPDALAAFVAGIDGVWWGFALKANAVDDQVDANSLFEVTFKAGAKLGEGRFQVRCLKRLECDPFGGGSAKEEGGTFRFFNLDPQSGGIGQGELEWTANLLPPERVVAFSNMQREERGGKALTFELGFPNGGPRSRIARRVVLGYGPWPEGAAPSVPDAGLTDGGAP